ncbi:MAG: CPBP family intramembrane glutamic endopeptidase [Acidobacteriota bacterium]
MSEPINLIKTIFFNDEEEFRCGWRVLIFFVLYVAIFLLINAVVFLLSALVPALKPLLTISTERPAAEWRELFGFMLYNAGSLLAVLAANAICARALEHRSFLSTGFALHKGWLRDFVWGLVLGATTLTVAVAIAAASGATTFNVQVSGINFLVFAFIVLAITFLISAANEEAMVRGFAFQALTHNIGAPIALLITSTIFGVLHLGNPSVSFFSTLNTILAGVWLGVAYLMTRSLWLATALHASWNFVMVFVFGLPVSGIVFYKNFGWFAGESPHWSWLSGGIYGPEGGAAATVALIVCTLVIWKSGLFSTSKEMVEAIKHGKRQPEMTRLFAKETDDGLQ